MYAMEKLVSERSRSHLEQAEQLRHERRVRAIRRARRLESRAERRMLKARRRIADLRGASSASY